MLKILCFWPPKLRLVALESCHGIRIGTEGTLRFDCSWKAEQSPLTPHLPGNPFRESHTLSARSSTYGFGWPMIYVDLYCYFMYFLYIIPYNL